jgi:hypothetical protein
MSVIVEIQSLTRPHRSTIVVKSNSQAGQQIAPVGREKEEKGNVEVAGANGRICSIFSYHAENAVYGKSIRAVLLFCLYYVALRAVQIRRNCWLPAFFYLISRERSFLALEA